MRRRPLVHCLLAATLLLGAVARTGASVDHYDVQHGLSQNSVVAIESDPRGFMWLGTEDGLNRFDGHSFRAFRSEPGLPGLPDSFVQQLARVEETLWIGTMGGGLARMDLRHERIEALAQRLPGAVPARQTIFALLPIDQARVLVGTPDGVHAVTWPQHGGTPSSRRLDAPGAALSQLVRVLAWLPDGRVLVGGSDGLCVYDPAFTACHDVPVEWPRGSRQPEIMAASADAAGKVWVAFGTVGLARVDIGTGEAEWWRFGSAALPLRMSRISALRAAGPGAVWIGSDIGTYRFDAGCGCAGSRLDQESGDDPDARKIVYALHGDDQGRVWIGAWNHGLDRYDPRRQAIERWSPRLAERPDARGHGVRAFMPDSDRVWLGVYGLGVIEASGLDTGATFRQPPSLQPADIAQSLVWALARDHRGDLWIGSDGGLARWNPATGMHAYAHGGDRSQPPQPLRSVRALLLDRRQQLWIGAEDGLFRIDPGAASATVELIAGDASNLPDRRIFALHEDRRGRIWLGTWQGVFEFDQGTGRVGAALAPSAHLRLTWDIADADDGGLWVGSSDGLVHVAPDGRWRRYTERDGFANRVVYGIERDDDGQLWLSTNRGIVRFDPRSGRSVNFGLQDQLQHTEFLFGAHARDDHGRLLFGGPGGFNRIDPEKLAHAGETPVPVLVGVRIDHREIEPGAGRIDLAVPLLERLQLRPGDSVLELHFGAIAHDQPREMRFRYRLAGYDRDWQDAGERRFATYTNLPPGEYAFAVEATDRFGNRSTAPRRLRVESLPWWWETATFRASVALLLLLAIALAIRWRLADLGRQREALRRQVAERTEQIRRQRDELEHANAELDKISRLDPLTGLANRRALLARLAEALRGPHLLAIALVDIDHFKRINDTRGHAVGDLALRHLAALWQAQLPAGALFGRYGGEEFLVLLPGRDAAGATALLRQLLGCLRTTPVPAVEPGLCLTASAGIAVRTDGDDMDGLIHRADQALYRAKNAGRDRCAIAD